MSISKILCSIPDQIKLRATPKYMDIRYEFFVNFLLISLIYINYVVQNQRGGCTLIILSIFERNMYIMEIAKKIHKFAIFGLFCISLLNKCITYKPIMVKIVNWAPIRIPLHNRIVLIVRKGNDLAILTV